MDISKTIAKYRKAKNLTQEALGELIGVSNQAVSKWENGSSSPDISLIPTLANALGISLKQLFGLSEETPRPERIPPDDFPEEAYEALLQLFFKSTTMRFSTAGPTDGEQLEAIKENIQRGRYLGCLSNTQGAFFMSKSFAFVDINFKAPNVGKVFDSAGHAALLRMLTSESLLRVLEYEYEVSFESSKSSGTALFSDDIAAACGMTVETATENLERLVVLNINERYESEDGRCEYYIRFQGMMFAVAIFKLVRDMVKEKVWQIVRDTQMIDDYAF